MGALSGAAAERACSALAAGCDIALHCSGVLAESEEVANVLPSIGAAAMDRLARALSRIEGIIPSNEPDTLTAKRDALLTYA